MYALNDDVVTNEPLSTVAVTPVNPLPSPRNDPVITTEEVDTCIGILLPTPSVTYCNVAVTPVLAFSRFNSP